MPKPLNADWNLAQVLYSQGVRYEDIAERIGVTEAALRQRAHRHGWRALRTEALQAVSQAVTNHDGQTLAEHSRAIRHTLASEIGGTAEALRLTPLKAESLEHLEQRAGVAQKLTSAAEKIFRWNEGSPEGMIRIGEMRSVTVVDEVQEQGAKQILDVPPCPQ
jgi:hypothetical protein